ncbi:MAG TPA: peptide deformylase, partial [Candidatus Eisenbacteria bacterium]|nr:peptide deformylase [Candidatus Eisenbacteria bacterium]
MAVKEILLLGNPLLNEPSAEALPGERDSIPAIVSDLHDTMMDFRRRHGLGRAIAAPQIGVMKRIIYMNTGEPHVFVNPVLTDMSGEEMEVWDDCMSFPDLMVRVLRVVDIRVEYMDARGERQYLEA